MILPAYSVPETPNPNIQQKLATIPDHDVWVSASAGSGKTKVLTDRVLRLLLPDPDGRWQGAAPHKILCITFTKAGAALMALRVQAKLGEWAVMNDDKLIKSLSDLLDVAPSPEMLLVARKLFSTVLDTQNGLSIMTIHAFCQSTIGRFAIEAGVTPGFSVMEEPRANDILRQIIDRLIIECEQNKHPNIAPSFKHISTYLDLDKLRDTLLSIMGKSREISEFLKTATSRDKIRASLLTHLGQDENLSADMCFEKLIADLSEPDLRKIAQILATGSPKYQVNGQKLADWLALSLSDRAKNIDLFADALVKKKDGEVRDVGAKIQQSHPEILDLINMSLSHYYIFKDRLACVLQAEQTSDLLIIVQKCLRDYTSRKKELNVLDFNDLILKTRTLLETQSLDWVHYKLDEGIDHILVDEAQDTNIHQWEIIRHLSDEFLSGTGNNQRLRSLFVVGDEKQSIFSFHGAAPEAFQTMRDFFEDRSLNALRQFKRIPLETSFRSVRPILQLVDNVFENAHLSTRLGLQHPQKLVHFPHRDKAGGVVELWDFELIPKPDTKSDIKWVMPPVSTHSEAQENEISTSSAMASRIATTINGWLEKGDILASSGLKIEPRDILILVRTRTNFVPDLVRQLKIRGIPVSGIDRMKLTDQIAVMDCLALAKFARFPEDDLSLACLLKSPLIRMDEDNLMGLALNRQSTLWDAVQEKCDARIVSWLQQAIYKSRTEKPFDFFDDMMNGICPYHETMTGWRAFATCLGADCLDPLDEFLSFCLRTEVDGVFSLEELVKILESNPIEIKRDTEDGEKDSINQVRIMTVHASKGLEAPIVFLPDTIGVPSKGKIDALQWMSGQSPLPIWAARSKDGCKAYQDLKDASFDKGLSEYLRLLYVALTRARDRLYIMGEGKTFQFNEMCWYQLICDAFEKLPYTQIGNVKRYEVAQSEPIESKTTHHGIVKASEAPPSWVLNKVTDDKIDRKITIRPSRLGADTREISRSPIDPDSINRFKRGNLTHKLFQILPDIPKENRQATADAFLSRLGQDLSADIRDDIVHEVLNILNDPVFGDVFGENSMAEVPISGDLGDGRMISGQIDRLIIGHNKILIVDFKTNRPSPRDENDIPEAYKNQLKAYKTALSRMFPDRDIACALLWTDQPLLMQVQI